jgi:HD superfamily phosphohydrolase
MAERPLIHRDQVHGDTALDPMSVALLNTAPMQRLGRVYQLGYAHLVFRGGTHTRLSHVMGAAHTAGRIVESLARNYAVPEAYWPPHVVKPRAFLPCSTGDLYARWDFLRHVTRWAALLHDLGHIPLGHTLEDEFDNLFEKHDDFASPRMATLWHDTAAGPSPIKEQLLRTELYPESFSQLGLGPRDIARDIWRTVMLIALFKEKRGNVAAGRSTRSFAQLLNDFLNGAPQIAKEKKISLDAQIAFVRELVAAYDSTKDRTFHPYMSDIVGNTICADYLDYLQRDAANVGLDVLRDDRVVSHFYVAQEQGGGYRMALSLIDRRGKERLDTCTGVVELVRQRYRFAEIIYYHKTKVAASAMFAKAIRLLGKGLQEIRPEPQPAITMDQISRDLETLKKDGRKALQQLRGAYLPEALMDVEIGDESLYPFLQQLAWRDIEGAVAKQDFKTAKERFRALRLIRGLATRSLYKAALSMDAKAFAELSPGSKSQAPAEERILPQINKLRSDHDHRTDIEDSMVRSTGWTDSEDALILYVPPRKSQAKGIETFALDTDGIVTLSDHPAVEKKVSELSRDYVQLWRLILLVDPSHRDDDVALSIAFDTMIAQLWPTTNLRDEKVIAVIRQAARFEYILPGERAAASDFVNVMSAAGKSVNWQIFKDVRDGYLLRVNGIVSGRELADRAALSSLVDRNVVSSDEVSLRFVNKLVSDEVDRQIEILPAASRESMKPPEQRARALEAIARGLAAPQLLLKPKS